MLIDLRRARAKYQSPFSTMSIHEHPSMASTPSIYSEISDPRARAHRPFSSFFSGTSTIGTSTISSRSNNTRRLSPKPSEDNHPRLPRVTQLSLSPMSVGPPTMRSPSSTRSIIDPSSSPLTSTQRMSTITFREDPLVLDFTVPSPARVLDYGGNLSIIAEPPVVRQTSGASRTSRARDHLRQRSQRSRPRWIPKHSRGKIWFPAMENAAVRTKLFHAIVSGILLVIILITCMFFSWY